MKFGVSYELQLRKPGAPRRQRDLYQNALDRLGCDHAWTVEHHVLLEEYPDTHAGISGRLELFAREATPEFRARKPQHQAWKRRVPAREVEPEELDTQPLCEGFGPDAVRVPQRPAAAAAAG